MWFYTFVCISALCARGVPAVIADGYYATHAQCMTAARHDWYARHARGREIRCQQVD